MPTAHTPTFFTCLLGGITTREGEGRKNISILAWEEKAGTSLSRWWWLVVLWDKALSHILLPISHIWEEEAALPGGRAGTLKAFYRQAGQKRHGMGFLFSLSLLLFFFYHGMQLVCTIKHCALMFHFGTQWATPPSGTHCSAIVLLSLSLPAQKEGTLLSLGRWGRGKFRGQGGGGGGGGRARRRLGSLSLLCCCSNW